MSAASWQRLQPGGGGAPEHARARALSGQGPAAVAGAPAVSLYLCHTACWCLIVNAAAGRLQPSDTSPWAAFCVGSILCVLNAADACSEFIVHRWQRVSTAKLGCLGLQRILIRQQLHGPVLVVKHIACCCCCVAFLTAVSALFSRVAGRRSWPRLCCSRNVQRAVHLVLVVAVRRAATTTTGPQTTWSLSRRRS